MRHAPRTFAAAAVTLLLLLSAWQCDTAKAPPVHIPTSPAPNGDPTIGGKCTPGKTIVVGGNTWECYDRHWRARP